MRIELDGPAAPTLPEGALSARGWTVQADEAGRRTEFWYDTPGLALLRWGVALVRVDDDLWRLWVPAQAGAEARVVEEGGDAQGPPPMVRDVVRPLVRGWELQRVVTMEATTRRLLLQREEAAGPVSVAHEARRVLDGPGVGRSWGRYVVEGEDAGLCESVVDLLGDVAPASGTPVMRALGSAAQAPPDVVVRPLGKRPSGAATLQAAITGSVHELLFRLAGVPLDADPEDVHRARVATRRLRGILRAFRPCFASEAVVSLDDELAWLATRLGPTRDADVMLERLGDTRGLLEEDEGAAAEGVLELLREERRGHWGEATEALRSPRCVALLDALVAMAAEPPLTARADAPAHRIMAGHTRRHWRRLRRRAHQAAKTLEEADLHRTRLAAKRVRYACETAALAEGEPAVRLATAVGRLQDVLGAHQDAVVLRDWLRRVARRHPGLALAASEMAGIEAARASDTAASWVEVWRRVERKRLRRWMRA